MNNIKQLRKEHGYTQGQLGKLCGVSAPAISYWENETKDINLKKIKQMADIFGCSIDHLLAYKEDNALQRECELLVRMYKTLSPLRRKDLLDTAELFRRKDARGEGM